MPRLSTDSFLEEMGKQAVLGGFLSKMVPKVVSRGIGRAGQVVGRQAGAMGAGAGLGAAGGAGVGAAGGGIKGYREAEEIGDSPIAGAITGAGGGALSGAGVGAALGGAAGLAGGARAADVAGRLASRKGTLGSLSRFGQRQLHATTGITPGGAARVLPSGRVNPEYAKAVSALRGPGGTHVATKEVGRTKKLVEGVGKKKGVKSKAYERALKKQQRAEGYLSTASEAESKGLTSVPGMVRSLGREGGVKDVWRLGVKPQLTQQGAVGKSMVVLPVGFAGMELAREGDPGESGRMERFGESLGMGAGYATSPFIPIAGSEVLSRGTAAAGGALGKTVDKLLKAKKKEKSQSLGDNSAAPTLEDGGQSEMVERVYSNAAQGLPPDELAL